MRATSSQGFWKFGHGAVSFSRVPFLSRPIGGAGAFRLGLLLLAMGVSACDGDVTGADWSRGADVSGLALRLNAKQLDLQPGDAAQIEVGVFDPSGKEIEIDESRITWSSSEPAVVRVERFGKISALKSGEASVTATYAEGNQSIRAVAVVTVRDAGPVVRVSASPAFQAMATDQATNLVAKAFDASGRAAANATFTWTSLNPAILTVDASGAAKAVAPGVARVVASAGSVADTVTLAVLGARSLLLTAVADDASRAEVRAGQAFAVKVDLDMSRLGSVGDLGSMQFDLLFDPTLVQFEGGSAGVAGSAVINLVEAGRLRFAFAATEAQGKAVLTLASLAFRMSGSATAGTQRGFTVVPAGKPTDTNLRSYEAPLTFGGTVRVVTP